MALGWRLLRIRLCFHQQSQQLQPHRLGAFAQRRGQRRLAVRPRVAAVRVRLGQCPGRSPPGFTTVMARIEVLKAIGKMVFEWDFMGFIHESMENLWRICGMLTGGITLPL